MTNKPQAWVPTLLKILNFNGQPEFKLELQSVGVCGCERSCQRTPEGVAEARTFLGRL